LLSVYTVNIINADATIRHLGCQFGPHRTKQK